MSTFQRYGLRHRYIGREVDGIALRRLLLGGIVLFFTVWWLWPNR